MDFNKPMRGVNLGGWLVLEKWMTPSLFDGIAAIDEFGFMRELGAAEKIKAHRQSFITEADFQWLKVNGIMAVRLPVGYWALQDDPPFIGTLKYIDWVFEMAERYDMQVLLCLHGAPGSQNGKDHSGSAGATNWYEKKNRQKTSETLIKIAERYGKKTSLWGIELLNEPAVSGWYQRRILRQWVAEVVDELDPHLSSSVKLIFSDCFDPVEWSGRVKHKRAVMDVHHYQCFSPSDKALSINQHLEKAQKLQSQLATWSQDQPVIIGEWSGALDGVISDQATTEYIKAQLAAFDSAAAWFFWSYKTEADNNWNFRSLVERNIIKL